MVSRLADIFKLDPQCSQLTVVATVAPPKPRIISHCWNIPTVTTPCGFGGPTPAIVAGSSFEIAMDTYNTGGTGKTKAVFKDGTTVIGSIENPSFPNCTGDQCIKPSYQWFPKVKYTMPNRTVQLAMELYGWDSSKGAWILTDSGSAVISTTIPGCSGIELLPYTSPADFKIGDKLDMAVSVWPGNIAYNVTFKDRTGTVLGSCKTSGTGTVASGSSCSFTWDSMASYAGGGKAGTYYAKAYANGCSSTECIIVVAAPILQRNLNVTVIDSATGKPVQGATVLVTIIPGVTPPTTGPQSKLTDVNGYATFRVDMGSVSVSISKNGYVTISTVESIYMDQNITYQLTPIPPIPTVGAIEFVSVPVGASIFVDGKDTGYTTPITIGNIPAGKHTYELRLTGYNNYIGEILVSSDTTVPIYATLTKLTPTTGSLSIKSHPAFGAEVWIDGKAIVQNNISARTPVVVTDISVGSHNIILKLTGFKDATGKFDIKAGETTTLDLELIPLLTIGSLEITSEPSNARVYVNNIDKERVTPATITNLTVGNYTYKLILDGYKDATGVFAIVAEKTTTIHVVLEKVVKPPIEEGIGLLIAGVVGLAIATVLMKKKK